MPRIRIKGKGLPKAQYQNSQVGQPYDPFGIAKMFQTPGNPGPYNVQSPLAPPQQIPVVSNPGAPTPWTPLSQGANQLTLNNPQSNFTWNWQNQDINGQSNAAPMPKQTVVNPNGSRTTTGTVDLGRAVQYATDKNANGSPSNSNVTTTTTKPSGLSKFNNGLSKFNQTVDTAFSFASAGLGYFDNKKKQREYDAWSAKSRQPHNMYAVDTHTDRGDYEINDGMFRPDQMGYKSKGTQANPYQASATFARDGGLVKAADGMLVPGDQIVNAAFLPDIKVSDAILAPRTTNTAPVAESSTSENRSARKLSSTGANPMAEETWNEYSQEFKGLTNLGIWGDKSHQARKSDHNTGDALDFGIKDINQGSAVVQKLIEDAKNKNVKYIIFNNKIWNPSISNDWRPYTGKDPHTGHVHVSFNRSESSTPQNNGLGDQVSYTHNNPMNVHYGDFAAKYGATPGSVDNGGKIAKFADLETGIRANKDLMFGPGYNNLTISQARNKWVNGDPGKFSSSTSHIVQAMGGDRRLADLNPAEKDKLFKEFTRWEGKQAYNLIKDRQIFDEGGQTNNTNMKIRILGTPEENNKNMKIRINGLPEENEMAEGGQPQYSGQSNYGLYIGQRDLYKTMAKNPYANLKGSVSQKEETQDDPYVLEAEGGETILRPDGSHMNITGDRHTEGGEKLTKSQAPKGSFIFSDTKKMRIKNPEVLKHFGKTGGDPTPAKLAKQYDVNKYRAILSDPNASVLSKKTAELMVKNYQNKLAQLALVQESMKGFPQGIPEVAKGLVPEQQGQEQGQQEQGQEPQAAYGGYFRNGGVPQYQVAGQAPASGPGGIDLNDPLGIKKMFDLAAQGKLAANSRTGVVSNGVASPAGGPNVNAANNGPAWFKPWMQSNTPQGRKSPTGQPTVFDPKDPNKFYTDYGFWKQLNGGKEFSGPDEYQNFVYKYVQNKDPKAIDAMWKKWGTTAKGKGLAKDQQFSINAFSDSDIAPKGKPYFGARTAEVTGWREQPTTTTTLAPGTPTTTTTAPPAGQPTTTTTRPPGPQPPTTTTTKPGKRGGNWTSQDIRDLGNAALDYGTLKKYHGYSPTVQPVLPEFIPQDWRGYAATQQANANSQAQQLGTFQGGQGMASNLSFLAGQQAGNLGDYISKVDQYNASGATDMDAKRAGILNTATATNAAARKNLWDEENVYDDKFRGAERGLRKGIVKAWNQGEENASKIYNLNQVESPYYTINPYTQRIQFNDANAKAAWEREQRGDGADETDSKLANWNKIYNSKELAGLDDDSRLAIAKGMTGYGTAAGTSNKKAKVTVDPVTRGNKTTETTYDKDGNPLTAEKFGGSIGASFVKSIGDWYSKLNYIADPNERQRVAEAYAHKMHFGR